MQKPKQRTRIKKRVRPVILGLYVAFWITVMIMFSILFINQMSTYNDLQAQLTRVNDDIEREQADAQLRELQLSMFDSDAYVEQLARSRGMVHPNEIVFRNIAD